MNFRKPFSALQIAFVIGLFFFSLLLQAEETLDGIIELEDPRTHSLNIPELQKRPAPPAPAAKSTSTFKILIDPGHGGKDLGAQGFFSTSEKDVALQIGRLTARELQRLSKVDINAPLMEVALTRTTDTFLSLKERVSRGNSWGADLFVSIHGNSSPSPKIRGFEVYFLDPEASDAQATKLARIENAGLSIPVKNDVFSILSDVQANYHVNESAQFAESVFSSMATRAITQARSVRQGPFTVLHGTTMPAILIEVGYLTNVEDALNLSKESYLKRLASAISNGIFDYALKRKKIREVRNLDDKSSRWSKTQRVTPSQNNSSLSHPSGG